MRPRLALALALAAAAGCAPVNWQRDGAEPIDVVNDLEACRFAADQAFPAAPAAREPNPSFGLITQQNSTPQGSTALVIPLLPGLGAAASVRQRRATQVDSCMRDKGYRRG